MVKLKIKKGNLPQRCEVCHQSDCYYPKYDICSRCYKASLGKMVFLKIKQKFQNLDKTMKMYTAKGALFLTILFTSVGLVFGIILMLVGHSPFYCHCDEPLNPYDIKMIPAIIFPVIMFFPGGSFFGLFHWLIGLSIRKAKLPIFNEIYVLLTSVSVASLSLGVFGVLYCFDDISVSKQIIRCSIIGMILGVIIWLISFLSRRVWK